MSILIAEDTSFQREYLRNLVTRKFEDYLPVIEVEDGLRAVEASNEARPNLIILDIKLPGLNGIKAARAIWRKRPLTRIVFWSQYKDETYLRELGKVVPGETVYGYVLKNSPDEKLTQALQAVLVDEQCWIDREVRGVQSRAGSRDLGLTDVEYEALIDISLGLTDKTIARRRYLSERGVQNRLRELYAKLHVVDSQVADPKWGHTFNPRGRAIWTALKRGLINADELAEEDEKLRAWLEVEVGFKAQAI
ncbi:MAG TPA: response regulator transcription factor [Pyrinomonadaceae bacterium]